MHYKTSGNGKDASGLRLRSDFGIRALSAFILVPICVGAILLGGKLYDALVAVLCGLMAREWSTIILPLKSSKVYRHTYSLLLAIPVFISTLIGPGTCVLFSVIMAIGLSMVALPKGTKAAQWLFVGVLSITMMGISLQWLREFPGLGHYVVLMLFISIWMIDTAAFFGGRLIGGFKLAPSISPNKTWAGLFSAMVAGALFFPVFHFVGLQFFPSLLDPYSLTVPTLLAAGGVFAILAQTGDLIESYLKRQFGVKDSGTLIPGHGGVLDRVDSFLVTAPVLALVLWVIGIDKAGH